MLKYSIEVQGTNGTYTQVADPKRRYTDALTSLEALTGEGTYRIRFGRSLKIEKTVVQDQPLVTTQFGIGAKVKFGLRGKVTWEVFRTGGHVVSLINPETDARKFDVPVSKLVSAQVVTPSAA